MIKVCTKCGEHKEATPEFFYRESRNSCGLAPICKSCKKAYDKKYASQVGYSKVARKYSEDDANCSRVEDDQYKNITIKCYSCSAELKVLFDTLSGKRKPRKQCQKCKEQIDRGMCFDVPDDVNPSELPYLDSLGSNLKFGGE